MNNNHLNKQKAFKITFQLIIITLLLVGTIVLFYLITDEIVLEKENGFDKMVYSFTDTVTTPFLTHVLTYLTILGSRAFQLPAYIILAAYFIFFKKNRKESIAISAVGILGSAVLFFTKNIFKRTRPDGPLITKSLTFSYPSGHTFFAFTFFGLLVYLIWQTKWRVITKRIISVSFIVLAVLVGFSRIYLHMHYASDVLAAFCLSVIWLTTSFMVLRKLNYL